MLNVPKIKINSPDKAKTETEKEKRKGERINKTTTTTMEKGDVACKMSLQN